MKIIFGICVLFHLLITYGVLSYTNSIHIGDFQHPVIYNRTFEIQAAPNPWYKSIYGFFTRSSKPVQNVTYTFPSTKFRSIRCLVTGIRVIDADQFGKGGLVKIVNGGLNQNNVTINFTSKPGEPMLFTVIINGYCVQNNPDEYNATPTNILRPTPTYGWIPASNASTFNSSSVVGKNITSPSSPWWHLGY